MLTSWQSLQHWASHSSDSICCSTV